MSRIKSIEELVGCKGLRAKNPQLFPHAAAAQAACISETLGVSGPVPNGIAEMPKGKRLRQHAGPKLNQTEQAFCAILCKQYSHEWVHIQKFALRLANGCVYWPDFVVIIPDGPGLSIEAYEVKGFMRDDAAVKIKVAASLYPFIRFTLAWKKSGEWETQIIRP